MFDKRCDISRCCFALSSSDASSFPPMFVGRYGVDLWINGHEHSYERTYPLHNGRSDRSNINPKVRRSAWSHP